MNFPDWLKANGYVEAELSEKEKLHLQAAWKAESHDEEKATNKQENRNTDFAARIAKIEADAERRKQIEDVCFRLCEKHIGNPEKIKQIKELSQIAMEDQSVSMQAFELQMLKLDLTPAAMTFGKVRSRANDREIEASICESAGMPYDQLTKNFDERTLENSRRAFPRGLGLQQLILLAANERGFRGTSREVEAMCRAAFGNYTNDIYGPMAHSSGVSYMDISGILSNVANKFMRAAFMFVEDTWRAISVIKPVNDFKQITSYRLVSNGQFKRVPSGGNIEHGELSETTFTNQADQYGIIYGFDRKDIINDDMGAFASMSAHVGKGGALKLVDAFWTEFLDDSTFFTSAAGNYDNGSDTLMDLTGLANAYTLFISRADESGNPIGAMPRIMLVPPQLWAAAWTLTQSPLLNLATSTSASTGSSSPWAGMFRLVQSLYLPAIGGNAAKKAWYLLADPTDIPVMEVCFLNGRQEPTIETSDFDFNRLGMSIRGVFDFGVKKQDNRGGVKMKGDS